MKDMMFLPRSGLLTVVITSWYVSKIVHTFQGSHRLERYTYKPKQCDQQAFNSVHIDGIVILCNSLFFVQLRVW